MTPANLHAAGIVDVLAFFSVTTGERKTDEVLLQHY